MDYRKWDMRTPWEAVGSVIYDADGGRVAIGNTQDYKIPDEADAAARAAFIVAAVNACAKAGGVELDGPVAWSYESKVAGAYDTHEIASQEQAEYHAGKYPDGEVFPLFRFTDGGSRPRAGGNPAPA